MSNPFRIRAFPAALSLSAFFLTSCLIIAGPDSTVLARLHPDVWWGAVMVASGAVFFFRNR